MSSHRPQRMQRLHHVLIALSLVAALSAYAAGQDKSPGARPKPEPAIAGSGDPMASYARMVPGEWRMTAQSGKSMFHTWHWGPGKHSIRRMTDGSGAGGEPWREVEVYYWHPGRKEVRLLGVSPFARGIFEGAMKFDGETAAADCDLFQIGDLRKIGVRWAFDGPDRYRETLLEATGPEGFKPLAELDNVRSEPPGVPRPRTVQGEEPSERLKALVPLLGHAWQAKGDRATGGSVDTQTSFEWIPLADAIYVRVVAPGTDGKHLLDAYFYHHTGANVLRCLALSDGGGVYEGDLTELDGGTLQIDLKGYEGDRVIPYVARLDFEKDGTLRHRVWSLNGTERTLLLDVQHQELETK